MRQTQPYPAPRRAARNLLWGLVLITSLILASCGTASANEDPGSVPTLQPPPTLPLESPTPFPTGQPSITTTPGANPTTTATTTTAPTTTATAPTTATTATATPTITGPVGQTGNWKLIFHDEFTGTSLDTSKWATCYFNFQVGNNTCDHDQGELELYQPSNISANNGTLTLQAKKGDVAASNSQTFHYTSGMITTGPSAQGAPATFTFTYGYMEMRAKIPAGQGFWPAFWTLPANKSWPPEIDVFEILGNQPNVINMHYHYPNGSSNGGDSGGEWTGPDLSADWHTYAVDWEPGSITWYVDGVARRHYTDANVTSQPMFLVANLAVGGDWPGPPNASTPFPGLFQIDYIRVWQK